MNLSTSEKLVLQQYFAGIPVKRAYLFGSMARNEAKPESDIDILVELDHSKPIGMKFFLYQSDLEELLHKKIDLITIEGLSRHVKPFIDKDKILIYERLDH
ncbi:nucleotidyltransferase [Niastella vici]|uniref:Nucleotidyltransferase n=1 Tax=Niastella vici TaxID=1703345 RepID=A0A1V9FLQ3_9BACT|nr:nucleotidyltransferase domain-containing protein [Niastella vici]OQP59268.1 nucleotidyltransferase [Niastella vici]